MEHGTWADWIQHARLPTMCGAYDGPRKPVAVALATTLITMLWDMEADEKQDAAWESG